MVNPIRPTDDGARDLALSLMRAARIASLGVITRDGSPMVSRIAIGLSPAGRPVSLVSDLSAHTTALRGNPACSLLLGEANGRGDPLNQPRLTLQARARFLPRDSDSHAEMAAHYLRDHPKSKLYIGFADFSFVLFDVQQAHLNGGFGKAFVLSPHDLDPGSA
ncbi:pyridoxamine 5'-phosphate oxidase family protein [Sedimentitalea sp. JM2-8]|uniref:Pyridoxamine 5'-phosphate oxidase family protein n=1 Tax=Sedimentitalea xiamensis TaxID=3050037 RepID=A0ABT7FK41_9RHOB|nr:pyridoxamine 5'-phosphate oxidase family protein [Sedimentitalea xiamensis]MDK3075526.1 pyridoxamine 5'-phosphate oxidase family protein [Sedimentitalea xiamensis]